MNYRTYGFTTDEEFDHVQHLLWSQAEKQFYTLITPVFGGGGTLDNAIMARPQLSLLKMGECKIPSSKKTLGMRNMYRCTLSHDEIEEKFKLYGNYRNFFKNNS